MQMWDTGLVDLWSKRTTTIPTACLNVKQRSTAKPRLGMRNLSGPFVILLIGYSASLVAFFIELSFSWYRSVH